jgi:hypothetical protein
MRRNAVKRDLRENRRLGRTRFSCRRRRQRRTHSRPHSGHVQEPEPFAIAGTINGRKSLPIEDVYKFVSPSEIVFRQRNGRDSLIGRCRQQPERVWYGRGLASKSKAARMTIKDLKPGIRSLVGCSLYSIQTAPKRSVSIEEINLASNASTAS